MNTLAPLRTAPRPRISLWFLRLVLTAHLAAVLYLPVLAGLFLTGDVDAIVVHGTIGSALAAVALVVIAATLTYVLAGRGRLWVLPVAVLLFLTEGVQIGFGFARALEFHVPLGVGITVASVLLVIWVWSPSAGRPRGSGAL